MARAPHVDRGIQLARLTILVTSGEAVVAIASGVAAGSIALLGFGLDSVMEVTAATAGLWRLSADAHDGRRERAERLALRVIALSFLGLALYVAAESGHALVTGDKPSASPVGVVLSVITLIAMPLLARAKRRVAIGVGSAALVAEAKQTSLCAYLSAILLVGLVLNAALGWWWADPVAALVMVPVIGREGIEGLRSGQHKECC